MSNKYKGAGVILRDSGNRILLVLGKKHNKWSFPKGHVDLTDKSPQMCAIRETKEETGLTVSIPDCTPFWRHNQYIYYFIEAVNVINGWRLCPQDKYEVARAQWMTEDEMTILTNGNSSVRKYVENSLRKVGEKQSNSFIEALTQDA